MSSELYRLTEYCTVHQLDRTFVQSLEEEGLIMVVHREEDSFVEEEQLRQLEVFTRWHLDMGVNIQGIDAMHHLVDRLREISRELDAVKLKLRLYEPVNTETEQ
jgi:hypothetical protein